MVSKGGNEVLKHNNTRASCFTYVWRPRSSAGEGVRGGDDSGHDR